MAEGSDEHGGGQIATLTTAWTQDFETFWYSDSLEKHPFRWGTLILLICTVLSALVIPFGSLHVDVMLEGFDKSDHITSKRESGVLRSTRDLNNYRDNSRGITELSTSHPTSDYTLEDIYRMVNSYPKWHVSLIYIHEGGGNILDPEILRQINLFEKAIYNSNVYQWVGWRDYKLSGEKLYYADDDELPPPAPIASLLQYVFPSLYDVNQTIERAWLYRCCSNEQQPIQGNGFTSHPCPWSWDTSDYSSIKYSSNMNCNSCCPKCLTGTTKCPLIPTREGSLHFDGLGRTQQDIKAALDYIVRSDNADETIWFMGSAFDPQSKILSTDKLRSEIIVGAPLYGYEDPLGDGQDSEALRHLKSIKSLLQNFNVPGVRLVYGGDLITELEVWETVKKDAFIAVSSCFIVYIYMVFHLRSYFVASLAVLQLAIPFPAALFFYSVVFRQSYLGPLNVLSLYIMVGIGVDDIFVFSNAFFYCRKPMRTRSRSAASFVRVSQQTIPSESTTDIIPLNQRLAYAIRKSGPPMLVTSSTSAAAFLANCVSSIPAVRGFGVLMGVLVILNYLLVMSLYPVILIIYSKFIHRFCKHRCNCLWRGKKGVHMTSLEEPPVEMGEMTLERGDSRVGLYTRSEQNPNIELPSSLSDLSMKFQDGTTVASSHNTSDYYYTVGFPDGCPVFPNFFADGETMQPRARIPNYSIFHAKDASKNGFLEIEGGLSTSSRYIKKPSADQTQQLIRLCECCKISQQDVPVYSTADEHSEMVIEKLSLDEIVYCDNMIDDFLKLNKTSKWIKSTPQNFTTLRQCVVVNYPEEGCPVLGSPDDDNPTDYFPNGTRFVILSERDCFIAVRSITDFNDNQTYWIKEPFHNATLKSNTLLYTDSQGQEPSSLELNAGDVIEISALSQPDQYIQVRLSNKKDHQKVYCERSKIDILKTTTHLHKISLHNDSDPVQLYEGINKNEVSGLVLHDGDEFFTDTLISLIDKESVVELKLSRHDQCLFARVSDLLSEGVGLTNSSFEIPNRELLVIPGLSSVSDNLTTDTDLIFGCAVTTSCGSGSIYDGVLVSDYQVGGIRACNEQQTPKTDIPHEVASTLELGNISIRGDNFSDDEDDFLIFDGREQSTCRILLNKYAFPFLFKARYILLVFFIALTGFQIFSATRLTHRDEAPSFYDSDHHIHIYRTADKLFSQGGHCINPDSSCAPNFHEKVNGGVHGCDGKLFSQLDFDDCGVCDGDGTTCRGCDGISNSGKKFVCGVCGGSCPTAFPTPSAPPTSDPLQTFVPAPLTPVPSIKIEKRALLAFNLTMGGSCPKDKELQHKQVILFDVYRIVSWVLDDTESLSIAAMDCRNEFYEVTIVVWSIYKTYLSGSTMKYFSDKLQSENFDATLERFPETTNPINYERVPINNFINKELPDTTAPTPVPCSCPVLPEQCIGVGLCDENGDCIYIKKISGEICNDNNPETKADSCDPNGICTGVNSCDSVVCTSPTDECHIQGQCIEGFCSTPSAPEGTPCQDQRGSCQGGRCRPHCDDGCPTSNSCTVGVCEHHSNNTFLCSYFINVGSACDDNNPETYDDTCQMVTPSEVKCLGKLQHSCDGITKCSVIDPQCQSSICDGSHCSSINKPDGYHCDDQNSKTTNDTCNNGFCNGVNLCSDVICEYTSRVIEVCNEPPYCDYITGRCVYRPLPDGIACDDFSKKTIGDRCIKGLCTGVSLCGDLSCAPETQCLYAGVCDLSHDLTPKCSHPHKPDGSNCKIVLRTNTVSTVAVDGECGGGICKLESRCSTDCPNSWLSDGHCDNECNVEKCNYDHGDCVPPPQHVFFLVLRLKANCYEFYNKTIEEQQNVISAIEIDISSELQLPPTDIVSEGTGCGSLVLGFKVLTSGEFQSSQEYISTTLSNITFVEARRTGILSPMSFGLLSAVVVAKLPILKPVSYERLIQITQPDKCFVPSDGSATPCGYNDKFDINCYDTPPSMITCSPNQFCDQECFCKGYLVQSEDGTCSQCSLKCSQIGGTCDYNNGACILCNGVSTYKDNDLTHSLDSCGVCGPPWPIGTNWKTAKANSTCKDCAGVLQGSKRLDSCGVCDGTSDCLIVNTPSTNTILLDIQYGIIGKKSFEDSNGKHPSYNNLFSPTTQQCQSFMLNTCLEVKRLASEHLEPHHDTPCFVEAMHNEMIASGGGGLPVSEESFGNHVFKFLLKNSKYIPLVLWFQSTPTSNDADVRALRLQFRTNVHKSGSPFSLVKEYHFWEDLITEMNKNAPPGCEMFQSCEEWPKAFIQVTAVNGLAYAIAISLLLSLVIILIFTAHIGITSLILITMGSIISATFSIFWTLGWQVGAVEAVALSVVVGLSVDYCLHLAEAYTDLLSHILLHEILFSRYAVMKRILSDIGIPLLNAAATTVLATIPLIFCTIKPLVQFGLIMVISISVSILFAIFMFVPMLLVVGPRPFNKTLRMRILAAAGPATIFGITVFVIYVSGATVYGPDGEVMLG